MSHNSSVAASLKPEQRKQLFIEMQSSGRKVTAIANREGVIPNPITKAYFSVESIN